MTCGNRVEMEEHRILVVYVEGEGCKMQCYAQCGRWVLEICAMVERYGLERSQCRDNFRMSCH